MKGLDGAAHWNRREGYVKYPLVLASRPTDQKIASPRPCARSGEKNLASREKGAKMVFLRSWALICLWVCASIDTPNLYFFIFFKDLSYICCSNLYTEKKMLDGRFDPLSSDVDLTRDPRPGGQSSLSFVLLSSDPVTSY